MTIRLRLNSRKYLKAATLVLLAEYRYKAEEEAGNSVNILFVTAEEPTKDMCLDRKPSFTISVGKTITISRSKIILDIVFNLLQKRVQKESH